MAAILGECNSESNRTPCKVSVVCILLAQQRGNFRIVNAEAIWPRRRGRPGLVTRSRHVERGLCDLGCRIAFGPRQIGLTRLSRTRDLLGVTGSHFMCQRVFGAMPNARAFSE
jgi:hypothetical protein